MRRGPALLLCVTLIAGVAAPVGATTAVKPGSKCVKVGNKSGSLTCKRMKGKLQWVRVSAPKKLTAVDLQPGLIRSDYTGYYEDDFAWFARSLPNLVSTERQVDLQQSRGDYFSVQWTGYFIPTESGRWTFTSVSDDGSQVWLGASAIEASPDRVGLLSAPGIHGPVTVSRSVVLEKGQLQPLRIQFGDATNWAQMTLKVRAPSASYETTDLTGLVWHSPSGSNMYSGIDPVYAKARMLTERKSAEGQIPVVSNASIFDPLDTCKLRTPAAYLGSEVRRGFPRSSYRLANTGTLHGLVLFVEFLDVKGSNDLTSRFSAYTERFVQFYAAQSYGRLSIKMDHTDRYIPISAASSKYGMQKHNGGNAWEYMRDALDAADPFVDFSPYDFVVVIPPAGVTEIVYGPAFPTSNDFLRTNEKVLYSGTVAGSDSIRNARGQWWWTAHEVGHLFGLQHQYSWSYVTYEADLFGIWDLMETGDEAPGLLAWHRFLLGWIDDDNGRCLEKSKLVSSGIVQLITPIESQQPGTKSLMIRINDAEALVVESRRNLGFDSVSEFDEGVLVYRVNVANHDNAQEVRIITQTPMPKGARIAGTLRAGESVTDLGVRVEVLANSAEGDYVRVTTSS